MSAIASAYMEEFKCHINNSDLNIKNEILELINSFINKDSLQSETTIPEPEPEMPVEVMKLNDGGNMLNLVKLNDMSCGMFNNKSYEGKCSSVLKSGVCKYFRRSVYDKFEWCIIEMMIFGLKNKGLMSNIINRLKILIYEEIVISEVDNIDKLIKLINMIEKETNWDNKVIKMLEFITIATNCKRGRICSYMNNWWKYHCKDIDYDYDAITINNIIKYKHPGDSDLLMKLGEKVLEYIENRDERLIEIFHHMLKITDKMGRRYKRKDAVFLYWEIIEDMFCKNEKFMRIFNFSIKMFYKKSMKERIYFGVWIGMFVINYDKLNWEYEHNYKFKIVNLVDYFNVRTNIEIDDYVKNDYHVNKQYGLSDFAEKGAYVKDEYLGDLVHGEKYREFYKKMKREQDTQIKPKRKAKKDSNKCHIDLEKDLEVINWDEFKVIKVIEEGVCGLKKPCIVIEYNNDKYVLKDCGKGLNWGRDYEFIDGLKEIFGITKLFIKRIRSNIGLYLINKEIRSFRNNWKLSDKDTIYCMMKYYDNIGDLGKNKNVLSDINLIKELYKIRLFDGLFRSSDNILRNILVSNDNRLISIDEGDIFGKRVKIFGKHDWCKKHLHLEIVNDCLDEFNIDKENKEILICDRLTEFGFNTKITEFKKRYDNYKSIIITELNNK